MVEALRLKGPVIDFGARRVDDVQMRRRSNPLDLTSESAALFLGGVEERELDTR